MQKILNFLSGLACGMVFIIVAFQFALDLNPMIVQRVNQWVVFFFGVDIAFRVLFQKRRIRYFLLHPFDLAIGLTVLSWVLPSQSFFIEGLWLQVGLLLISLGRLPHLVSVVKKMPVNPSQTLVLWFLLSIVVGGVFLSLPISIKPGVEVDFLDAIFTATSAVCVTGLTTLQINETFSLVGQAIILILIQLGGLGIMSFSVVLSFFLYKKVTQIEGGVLKDNFESKNTSESFEIIKAIFKYTLLFEVIGASILFFLWIPAYPNKIEGMYYAFFHAVSAFCNAGFSLFSDSFISFSDQPSTLLVISVLIMFGGLGFPIMLNIMQHRLDAFRSKNLKLQTKISLTVSTILWIGGTFLIWSIERQGVLADFTSGNQWVLAFFHSVSARTAGFSALDITIFHPATLLVIMTLMYIGVSPGSTGGGIKTTTVGILVLTLWRNLTQKKKIAAFGRTITTENVFKALSIVTLSGMLILSGLGILLMTEKAHFLNHFFEIISALSTTGLSLGVTDDLSNTGKKIIMVMMFVGRTGPLTVGFALARHRKERNYSYPEESVMVA